MHGVYLGGAPAYGARFDELHLGGHLKFAAGEDARAVTAIQNRH